MPHRIFSGKLCRPVHAGACIILLFVTACAADPVGVRYRAERDLWRARRLESQMRIRTDTPVTNEEADRVLAAYRRVLDASPLPPGAADTAFVHGVGRVRAQAQFGIVRMAVLKGDSVTARMTLERGRTEYPWDLGLTLGFDLQLIELQRGLQNPDAAVAILREMTAKLPPRLTGRPVVPVQEAPIRAAEILFDSGQIEAGNEALLAAEAYYREVLAASPGDQAAAYATIELGTVAARLGRFDDAAARLEEARGSTGAGDLEPKILFLMGVLQQDGRRDPLAASRAFEEMLTRYPQDPAASEAMLRQAVCLATQGKQDDALAVLAKLEESYPRDRTMIPRARSTAARILSQGGRWTEALSRYRQIDADFPSSPEALRAPLEIAAHYRAAGEKEAAETTLLTALDRYDTMAQTNPRTPLARAADETAVQALFALERWNDGAERLLAFPQKYPNDPRNAKAMADAAMVYRDKLGNRVKATEILQSLASTYPQSPIAARALDEVRRLRGN